MKTKWTVGPLFVAGLCALYCANPKRLHKLNIGTVSWIIYIVVLAIGWLLGGPVGVGTIISTFGTGIAMRYVFRIVQFEPRLVKHESLWDVVQRLRGKELVKEEPQ